MKGNPSLPAWEGYVVVGLPLLSALLCVAAGDRWIVQASAKIYVWLAVSSVLYGLALLTPPAVRGERVKSLKWAGFMLFWSVVGGFTTGGLALTLLNCAADVSPAEPAVIEDVKYKHRVVRIRIAAPAPGTEFDVPNSVWDENGEEAARFFVHRGRLGFRWGEFR